MSSNLISLGRGFLGRLLFARADGGVAQLVTTTPEPYAMLTAATADGPEVGPIEGLSYILTVEADFTGGGKYALQRKKLDGSGFTPALDASSVAIEFTASGSKSLVIGQGAILKLVKTGTVGAAYATLAATA